MNETEADGGHDVSRDAEAADALERARAAEERARSLEVRLQVERCARRAGVVDEDAAYRLMDLQELEYDAAGRPANVEELMQRLLEARPWLRRGGAGPDGAPAAGPGAAGASPANPPRDAVRSMSRDAIRRMTPDQINANWEAVEAALRHDA
jgi:predicted phage gp36 major capsid-like protein